MPAFNGERPAEARADDRRRGGTRPRAGKPSPRKLPPAAGPELLMRGHSLPP